ncbi:DUF6624 domain-containing protein [Fibrella arboris]|uniref:DUF6624 domain-containing protein n=1 Tax=Fibrella arboris TaxID=3242486 RepID=UPI0035208C01
MSPFSVAALYFVVLCIAHQSFAQTTYSTKDTAYIHAVEQGLQLLKQGDCQRCLAAYRKAFAITQKSALSTIRAAACAYQCRQHDVATAYLQKAIDIDYEAVGDVWNDQQSYPELSLLRTPVIAAHVDSLFVQKDKQLGLNVPLKKQLETLHKTDQQPRMRLDSVERVYGQNSPQMRELWKQISHNDSVNLISIKRIMAQYGYPGKRVVGPQQANTAWLIIQHSPLQEQEMYLPLMQAAAASGEMAKSSLALLIDRINVAKTGKQIYGSQVSIAPSGKRSFFPIEDEQNVNKRRAEMNLNSIEEYAKQFGFEYKPGTN